MRVLCGQILAVTMLALVSLVANARQIDVDDKTLAANSMEGVVYDGIDVSSYQEDIDWSATAKDPNIKFVYVKATEGATYRSRHYVFNIENARKHGIKVGSYHFFRPQVPVRRQFENFTSVVKKEDQDLIPLIDVETRRGVTAEQLVDSVQAFADLLQQHYGCRPMIYTGVSFYNSHLRGHFDGYKLFIARYSRFQPRLVGAQWTLWQFSESGRIAGIDHDVDLCRFNAGASLRDILMPGRRSSSDRRRPSEPQATPPPPPRRTADQQSAQQQQPVPYSKKQLKKMEQQRKEAEKRAKHDAEVRARQQADSARQARRHQQQAEKARKEEEKRLAKEKEKQEKRQREAREKLARQQAEQLKKDKEAQEKAKLEQAEQEKKAAAQRAKSKKQQEAEAQRKARDAEKAAQKAAAASKAKSVSADASAKSQGKRVNQSSADNDE